MFKCRLVKIRIVDSNHNLRRNHLSNSVSHIQFVLATSSIVKNYNYFFLLTISNVLQSTSIIKRSVKNVTTHSKLFQFLFQSVSPAPPTTSPTPNKRGRPRRSSNDLAKKSISEDGSVVAPEPETVATTTAASKRKAENSEETGAQIKKKKTVTSPRYYLQDKHNFEKKIFLAINETMFNEGIYSNTPNFSQKVSELK